MMTRSYRIAAAVAALCFTALTAAAADSAPFDLKGPDVEVLVTRGGKTLPIAKVPALQAGDRLRIHPDLPDTQSVHYLLIIAFMRGVTNPPPPTWFFKAETWKPPFHDEGLEVTVPAEAQQAAIFLAPETSGDIKTLRNAVRGRPGSFVRVLQDLNLASLERARVETYLAAMHQVPPTDEAAIKEDSTTLARSLSLKINQDCFLRPTSEQAQCLTTNTESMAVDMGQSSTSVVAQLTTGATSDLATQLAYTPGAGAGYYSAYVGAIFDVARILDGLHTALYQYIPALSSADNDTMHTKLNVPPSFRNPKSVIIISLPPVEPTALPTLSPVNLKQAACLQKPHTVLGIVGDPALYSTQYGHDFVLHFTDKQGKPLDLPATPDATLGGLKLDGSKVDTSRFALSATGALKGMWGFAAYDGPTFTFDISHASSWKVASTDQTALVIGRTDTLHLEDDEAACVSEVDVKVPGGSTSKAEFKISKPTEIEVQVPLKDAQPGALSVLVKEWGLATTDEVALNSYAEAGHLDSLTAYAGDPQILLKGTRLDEVSGVDFQNVHFNPGKLSREGGQDQLTLIAANAPAAQAFTVGQSGKAKFSLKDGRTLELPVEIAPARPRVTTLSRDVQVPANDNSIHLTDQGEVPQDGSLTFSLKTVIPAAFPRSEKIEVATEDDSLKTTLSLSDSSLVLEDATTMLATLDPRKSFGPSIFGPLRYRPVANDGTTGDWQSLGTVVRLPVVAGVTCPRLPRHAEPSAPENAPLVAPVNAPATAAAPDAAATTVAPTPSTPEASTPDANTPAASSQPGIAPSNPGDAVTLQPGRRTLKVDAPPAALPDPAQATSCTLRGSNLFLIDSIASDAAFTHSIQVPEGFPGQSINVPRPQAKTLYVKLRDDPDVVNTLQVP